MPQLECRVDNSVRSTNTAQISDPGIMQARPAGRIGLGAEQSAVWLGRKRCTDLAGRKPCILLSSSDLDVRTFSAVVESLAPHVNVGKTKFAARGIVGTIAMSDDRSGRKPLRLH